MTENLEHTTAIRTPDQRLRVFVSSTLTELADERAEVARAISALRLTPVLFELGARAHPPQDLYRAYLEQSDIFIGLYWQRYGWVGPGMEVSGLEDEFQLSQSMPRLLYIKAPAPDRDAQLTAMLDRIRAEPTDSYRAFRSPRELGRLVRDDLAMLLSERFVGRPAPSSPAVSRDPANSARLGALPITSTPLIGRDQDVGKIAELLETDDVRLVTLTGPGGIGKTRLALAVANSVVRREKRGVVFVPLAGVAQPELVLPKIAAVLGAQIDTGNSPAEILAEHLAEDPTLLVLDNLEQVVGVAPELDELLARCPSLQILATSRTVLRLRSEHEYVVAPLAVPGSNEAQSIQELALTPAVALFIERSKAVRRDFTLDAGNAWAVVEICRRLEGLPLAIELAAARVRLLDPAALLARLGRRLDTLDSGPVDLPIRQRTLRATIEWSFELLDGRERDMLTALAVFVDGWTLDAAVQVTSVTEEQALDLIDALVGHSLVQVTTEGGGPRFRMLETVREFCAERLEARPEIDAIRRRHAAYFRRLVETSHWPSPGESEWADNLLTEEGNLRLAIGWFMDHDITPLPHIFLTLWRFWQLRDRMAEGRGWISELLPRASTLDDAAQAELWLAWAMSAAEVGDDESALTAASELDQLQARTNDAYLDSVAHMARSWILPIVNDFEGALRAATLALEGFRRQDQKFMAANATFTLGMLEMAMGRQSEAGRHLAEVRSLGKDRFGNNWLTSVACVRLASLAAMSGDVADARALLLESLEVNEGTERSTLVVTFCLVAYAELALREGDPSRAALALGATSGLRRRAGLVAWPLARAGERTVLGEVRGRLAPDEFKAAFERGTQLSRRQAVAVVKGEDGSSVARRVDKTFMFTDIVRSTNLVDALGDEAWGALLAWHDETLRRLFIAHGGEEVVATGDGFFVSFDSPAAAISCAIDLQRTLSEHRRTHGFAPAVRIGLHTAPADQVDRNFRGKGVHQAARIAALGKGDEILASIETARDRTSISEPRTVALKGIAAPVDVVTINWQESSEVY